MLRRRRSRVLAVLIVVVAAAAVVGGLGYLVKREPDYYARPNEATLDPFTSANVLTRFGDLKNDIRSKGEWGAAFTADELDAFLRENMEDDGFLRAVLPPSFHDPRVVVDGDRLKMAVRYGDGFFSSVVNIELKAWLVGEELNTVAVEVVDLSAGSLPIGAKWLLDKITEAANEGNVEVRWYRHDGHPVGLFHFYANQARPATQIRAVSIADGQIVVAGRTGGE